MSARNSRPAPGATHELFISHVFDAPPALVFEAWTKAEHRLRWWGPKDYTVLSCEMDFRVGGAYRIGIRSPEGVDYWMHGVHRTIVEAERLAFTFAWEEEGERGLETLVTVTFVEQDGKTRMSFHQAPFHSIAERDGHQGGWSECLDRLAAYAATPA